MTQLPNLLPRPPRPGNSEGRREAAVLVPVMERAGRESIMFIVRADHLSSHAGQVAFPGGVREAEDDSAAAAALREAQEEVGLAPEKVRIAGFLDQQKTLTGAKGFIIQPVVGLVTPDAKLVRDSSEVAEIFEVPLAWVMDPAHHRRERAFWNGRWREYYVMDWQGRRIWGATASIVRNFYETSFA